MAPLLPSPNPTFARLARRALVTAGPALAQPHLQHLARRELSVNRTQGITLGIIAVYVVVIALLWNLPYVRWVLWPFKVRMHNSHLSRLDNCAASREWPCIVVRGMEFPIKYPSSQIWGKAINYIFRCSLSPSTNSGMLSQPAALVAEWNRSLWIPTKEA